MALDKDDRRKISLPFVMEVPWTTWVQFCVAFLVISMILMFMVQKTIDHKEYLPFWGYFALGPFFLLSYVFLFWFVAKVKCDEAGLKFSSFYITYSRIPWEEIVKVKIQSYSNDYYGGTTPKIFIYRKPGISVLLERVAYRPKDLGALIHLLRKHAAHVKVEKA